MLAIIITAVVAFLIGLVIGAIVTSPNPRDTGIPNGPIVSPFPPEPKAPRYDGLGDCAICRKLVLGTQARTIYDAGGELPYAHLHCLGSSRHRSQIKIREFADPTCMHAAH